MLLPQAGAELEPAGARTGTRISGGAGQVGWQRLWVGRYGGEEAVGGTEVVHVCVWGGMGWRGRGARQLCIQHQPQVGARTGTTAAA